MVEAKNAVLLAGVLAALAGWTALQWISGDTADPEKPAPMLERSYSLEKVPKSALLTVAVAGWCEIAVRGTPGAKVMIDYDEVVTATVCVS